MTQSQNSTANFPKVGAPALRALTAAGYEQLAQLSQVSEAELLKLHGIGPKAIRILRDALAAQELAFANGKPAKASKGNYAEVNGLKFYYEIHGPKSSTQTPLVLLHGGLGLIEMMSSVLDVFLQDRQVIGVDLQGHGRTADVDRPMRYETMGDDIAALIRHLGIAKADVMGYSLGGGVALRTAIQHSDLVRRLLLVSAPFKRNGWFPEVLAGMDQLSAASAEFMRESPMYQSYVSVAPKPENFPVLVEKTGDLLRQPYDWSNEVKALPMPVMLVFADADSIPPSHAAEFFGLLGGGQRDADWDRSGMTQHRLAILPGQTHYDVFASPFLPTLVQTFLDTKS
ncbi:MAG: alpha/beta fold hydrolase [Caldilineaceae bacterium]